MSAEVIFSITHQFVKSLKVVWLKRATTDALINVGITICILFTINFFTIPFPCIAPISTCLDKKDMNKILGDKSLIRSL